MNKKRVFRLLGLLILLFCILFGYWLIKNSSSEEETSEELYTAISIETQKVTKIGIIGEETIDLTKENEEWKLDGDSDLIVDEDAVETYLSKACSITSSTCIENVTDFSQYGLDAPALNITLQWDEDMYLLKVGDYNSVIGSYYLWVNDEDRVYTIISSQYYALNKSLTDFEKAAE